MEDPCGRDFLKKVTNHHQEPACRSLVKTEREPVFPVNELSTAVVLDTGALAVLFQFS